MEEDLRIGDRVYIKPVEKYGIVQQDKTWDNHYWVDYEDEYGGKYWWRDALVKVEEF